MVLLNLKESAAAVQERAGSCTGVSIVGSAVYYFVGALVVLIVNEYGLTTLGLAKEGPASCSSPWRSASRSARSSRAASR